MSGQSTIQHVQWRKCVACHASLGDRPMVLWLGRSLALPTYGFVYVTVRTMRHRSFGVSQSRTLI